jgi:hypothetical protein
VNSFIPTQTPEEREALDAIPVAMELRIKPKDQYGTTVFYPACRAAVLFAEIAGTKTLTRDTIQLIMQLGYTVTYVHSTLDYP